MRRSPAVSQLAERWEYLSLVCDGFELEMELAPLGEQGWEAVGFAPAAHGAVDITVPKIDGENIGNYMITQWKASQYRILLKRRKQ